MQLKMTWLRKLHLAFYSLNEGFTNSLELLL